jgi:hypothetical protein
MAAATLALINSEISLGLQVGSVLIPIIKGAIADIKQELTPQGTVTYTVVIATDQAELADVASISIADLIAINAELKAQGAKPLDVPPAPPAAS